MDKGNEDKDKRFCHEEANEEAGKSREDPK